MRSYHCCLAIFVLTLFVCFIQQGNCQAQNENVQQPTSVNKKGGSNWSRDWRNWAGVFNGPAGGVKPRWFQLADQYMTNMTGTGTGTNNQGGFFANLFDRINKQKKVKKDKKKNKAKDITPVVHVY